MSPVQEERAQNHEGTFDSSTSWAEGIHEDPDGVTVQIPAWTSPIGVARGVQTGFVRSLHTEQGTVTWSPMCVRELRLSRQAHLLLLQGYNLSQFFLASVFRVTPKVTIEPPMILLGVKYPDLWRAPFVLQNLRLGKIVTKPDELNLSDLFGPMLADMQKMSDSSA